MKENNGKVYLINFEEIYPREDVVSLVEDCRLSSVSKVVNIFTILCIDSTNPTLKFCTPIDVDHKPFELCKPPELSFLKNEKFLVNIDTPHTPEACAKLLEDDYGLKNIYFLKITLYMLHREWIDAKLQELARLQKLFPDPLTPADSEKLPALEEQEWQQAINSKKKGEQKKLLAVLLAAKRVPRSEMEQRIIKGANNISRYIGDGIHLGADLGLPPLEKYFSNERRASRARPAKN